MLERTRCFAARLLLPPLYGIVKVALLLFPRTHPFRIYATDRAKTMAEMSTVASTICTPGRRLPFYAHLILAYLALDSISTRVKGPTDLIEWWRVDDHVRIFARIEEFLAGGAPLFAGLLLLI